MPPRIQRGAVACCRIRAVSSVTWLNTLRRSPISVLIFRSACITVVWSRPPNWAPILGRSYLEAAVELAERGIAAPKTIEESA